MWFIGSFAVLAGAYCIAYAVYCIKKQSPTASAVSFILALLPLAVFTVCLIFR